MIFPRVHRSARRLSLVAVHACSCTCTNIRRRRRCASIGRDGTRGWFLCVRARAYHPIRTLALGLLNATSVQLPCNVRVSIYPFIGWQRQRRAQGEGGESGGSGEDKVGGCRWRRGWMVGTYVLSASLITERYYAARVYTHDRESGILTEVPGKIIRIEFPFERCVL